MISENKPQKDMRTILKYKDYYQKLHEISCNDNTFPF